MLSASKAPQPPFAALQADDPFRAAVDGLVVARAAASRARAVHRHDHHGGVVEVGIVGVAVLEGPAAGAHVRPLARPSRPSRPAPAAAAASPGRAPRRARRLARRVSIRAWRDQRGVPHRRDAGLAVGLVVLDRPAASRPTARAMARCGMVRRIAERVVHHHAVGHGRIDRAQPVLAVQPLGDEARAARRWRAGAAPSARTARPPSAPRPAR